MPVLSPLTRYQGGRAAVEAIIAKYGMTYADYSNYYRWNLPEWAYHQTEVQVFRVLDPLIGHANEIESNDPGGFDTFRSQLYGTMILAIKDLDEEEFFGTGAQREAIVLFCDLVEPPEKNWFAHESARLLNPTSTFRDFSGQWLAWQSPADREIVHSPGRHSPVYAPLQEFLAGHGYA